MNKRIQQLREMSLNATNRLTSERAMLITRFYKNIEGQNIPTPVLRAKAFEYILANKKIYINPNELIVGERGPEPKATPTYPEINLHTLEDLDILNDRKKVSFKVDELTRSDYENTIIPFWEGKTQRDIIFGSLDEKWKEAYSAGVFTEFQEQRAPGHTVAGKKIFQKGLNDLINDVEKSKANLLQNESAHVDKLAELEAMEIVAKAMIMYANRHAEKAKAMAALQESDERKKDLLEVARICEKVPANAPESFHEMLQHYWFFHLGVITELNPWDSFNPGRLDQHLYPFFEKEMQTNQLTKESAEELLQCFWVKFNNHPSPPKMGITAKESNTYTDFALINLGGVKPDGSNAVNELTYIILDVIEEMRILQPSSMVQISKKNPDRFVKRALKIARTGFGQPSFFNTDAIVQQLLAQGKAIEDARNGGASGCIETGAFGTESYVLTGYFNLTKVLEITMNNGVDPASGKQLGLTTGNFTDFNNFEELYDAFEKQLQHFIDIKIEGNLIIEKLYAERMPVPFLSLIIDDCITNAVDYNAGGARYNTSYIQGVGLGSIADNFAAINELVFKQKVVSQEEMMDALKNDFEGYKELRFKAVYESPKYGNDDNRADQYAVKVFNSYYHAVDGRDTYRGGKFRINMLPTTSHVYFGSKIGAMPDGRKAKKPLSEGISPVQGADQKGPTAVLNSAAKIDHIKTGGTLLNQKFAPSFFAGDEALDKLTSLVRSYFKLDGHHIQFNVVDEDTLRKAQKNPENYRDLIVRVAGYSDYFNDLTEELQEEIIKRTAHEQV